MDSPTSKKIVYLTAFALSADIVHLKSEPHTHQDREEGPPIHERVATAASNIAASSLSYGANTDAFDLELRLPQSKI